MSSASGLSERNRAHARDITMTAAFLALHNAPEIHYTQGQRRWDGINKDLRAWRGEYPRYADCSAFVTWCIWNALRHFGVRDTVNAQDWKAGYTGTMLEHGKPLAHEENILYGDAAIYGEPGTTGKHTAICIGGGKVISHGSEGGPYLLDLHYRPDLITIRRYI